MRTIEELAAERSFTAAQVEGFIELAKRSMVPLKERIFVRDGLRDEYINVVRNGVGPLDTEHGWFEHFDFAVDDIWQKYSVLYYGPITADFFPSFAESDSPISLRIDSGCETGQMFGDRTCECRDQLHLAMARIATAGQGMIVNIPSQDGRGFRLPNKLATLRLQRDLGIDTVEAGGLIVPGGSMDIRTYAGVVAILRFLRIASDHPIVLLSNNSKKEAIFRDNGFSVVKDSLVVPPTERTRRHLQAKQDHLGHVGLVEPGAPQVE